VARVGAVIGSEFSYELLRAVHPIPEEELQEGLRKLADAELIYVHGIPPEANYTFKNALVRDAAYEALLKSRRRDLHGLVASTINDKFSAFKETHPEVLVWCPLPMLLLTHSERGTEHFFPRPLTRSGGRGKNVAGRGAGFRIRDAKPRRSAEAGQDSFPWPTTPIAASQPMNEIG
jgi:hypothetical protein